MKHVINIVLISALAAPSALASFEEAQSDARALAMGGAWAALSDGASPDQPNPASLTRGGWGASAGFSLPFGMAELASVTSAVRTGRGRLGLGLALGSMGGALYRESSFRASAAWTFHRLLSAGVSLGGYQLSVQNYGSAFSAGLDAGVLGNPHPRLALGLAARNLNRPRLGDPPQELAQELSAGLAYSPGDRAVTAVQLQAQQGWPVQWRVGQEFRVWRGVSARAGYSAKPAAVSGGLGLEWSGYSAAYSVRTHPELGMSHCLTLSYAPSGVPGPAPDTAGTIGPASRKVVLNAAPISELEMLPGVGARQAADIAALRDSLGGLNYLDELLAVRGMTRGKLERLAPFVDLGFDPAAPRAEWPLDINRATAGELAMLPGIGPMTASFIVSYRQDNGPFQDIEDLMKVKGIGRKTFEGIRDLVTAGKGD